MQQQPKTARAPESENTKLWNSLVDTPPEYLKQFKKAGGFGGKSIDPTYRIRRLTEAFGPVGKGWGFVQEDQWSDAGSGAYVVYVRGHIWYMLDGEEYMTNSHTGGTVCDRTPDEAYKMAETDALGKCCVDLGLSCDVYMGEHDGDKYQRVESGEQRQINAAEAGRRPAGSKPTEAPQANRKRTVVPIKPEDIESVAREIRALADDVSALTYSQNLFHRLLASGDLGKDRSKLTGVIAEKRCQVCTAETLPAVKKFMEAVVKQKWLTEAAANKYISLTERRLGIAPVASEEGKEEDGQT